MHRHRARGASAPSSAVDWSGLIERLFDEVEPVTVPGLIRSFEVDRSDEGALRRQMVFLEKQGIVHSARRGRWIARTKVSVAVGRLTCPGRHFGFVVRDDGAKPDIHIGARRLNGARHGDRVLVRIVDRRRGLMGSDGEILAVLEERPSRVPGVLTRTRHGGIFEPLDRRVGTVHVTEAAAGSTGGMEIAWAELGDHRNEPAEGRARVVEVIGPPEGQGVLESLVASWHSLPGEFPEAVAGAADRLPESVPADERLMRSDFTGECVVTIDPPDARDHDDAVGVTRRGRGFRLSVHIADVGWYVPEGSVIDREAMKRGVSVYFPGRCIPMLPEGLSARRCSLLPGEERMSRSVILDFDEHGAPGACSFADGVVRSSAHLTYEEVDGRPGSVGEEKITAMLQELDELSILLKESRLRRGALELRLRETKIQVDEAARPTGVAVAEPGRSHRMVEEAMLAANEAVARHLSAALRHAIYRIHEEPDAGAIAQVEEQIAAAGIRVRRTGGGAAARLRGILDGCRGRPEEEAVSHMVLRALKLACYSSEAAPHFGLAAPVYTHFTSPIRRYPDLVVHRLMKTASGRPRGSDDEEQRRRLLRVARECSRLERRAEEAERMIVRMKSALFMKDSIGVAFHGRVIGFSGDAVFVRLDETGCEGVLNTADRAAGAGPAPRSRRGRSQRGNSAAGKLPAPGAAVHVKVVDVDVPRGRIALRLLSNG